MKRRNILVGMGGLAAGSSALVGSGAFTSVEANRGVAVAVVDDPDALLGLDGCEGSPNGEYARIQDSGTMAIDLSPSNDEISGGGEGVNPEAQTVIRDVFQIKNQGTQEVAVWIDVNPVEDDQGEPRVKFYLHEQDIDENENEDIVGHENRVCLDVGDSVCISMNIDTRGLGADFENGDGINNLLLELTNGSEMVINADAEETPCGAEPVVPEGTYQVSQDGQSLGCFEPVIGEVPVEDYYDYTSFASQNEDLNSLNSADGDGPKSVIFFYKQGPEGPTSLVVLHGSTEDEDGSAVDFDFGGTLPTSEGQWVVKDDPNDGDFDQGPDNPRWAWQGGYTDGGAWRGGLNECPGITINPEFEDPDRAELVDFNEIGTWYVHGGDGTTIELDKDAQLTIECCGGDIDFQPEPL